MNTIRQFLKGKKTYIMAIVGVLTAVAAWADGQIELTSLVGAIWAAAQTAFIRAGVDKAVEKKEG